MNLNSAVVVGYFSLPSAELAEANPSAYATAMADAPVGAGTCAHCGTGIRNHVVVECDGVRAFIGTSCAEKVGCEAMRRCVRERKTAAEVAADDARRAALAVEDAMRAEKFAALAARRAAVVGKYAALLRDGRGGFCDSVADGLERGILPHGRGLDIALDIIARQSGRRNSNAYGAALNTAMMDFETAELISA